VCGSFEAWASDLGYDPDSRKAEKVFKACEGIKLRLSGFWVMTTRHLQKRRGTTKA